MRVERVSRAELGSSVEQVSVLVPARDEAELIERCIDAIDAAARALAGVRPEVVARVVVVADGCVDDTAALARCGGAETIELTAGGVGAARRAGADAVLSPPAPHPGAHLLAFTDADSQVPVNWLIAAVRHAEAGADVVVGTVRPHLADRSPAFRELWRRTHRPGHPNGHVHGANLIVRASAYLAAGGFDDRRVGEDVDLVARLRAAGAIEVADDSAEVVTSARLHGRAAGGYATHLAELEAGLRVESAESAESAKSAKSAKSAESAAQHAGR